MTTGFARAAVGWFCAALWLAAGCGSDDFVSQSEDITVLGSRGTGPGRFSSPRGIDIAVDGRIAIADKTGRIQLLGAEGDFITEWKLLKVDNGTPTGIIFDATDPTTTTLLVADTHNSRIFRYSLDGHVAHVFGEYGGEPGKMIYPTDIAVDAAGNMYVTEYGINDRVMKFDRGGRFIEEWGSFGTGLSQFHRPLALVFAPPDRIIVADTCNHRIQIFSTEGELIDVIGEVGNAPGQFNYPYDIALGADGLLYVLEYGNNRLQVVDIEGKSQAIFGRAGSAPGEFAVPWGIAIGRRQGTETIFVADTNNHRLQVMSKDAVMSAMLIGSEERLSE